MALPGAVVDGEFVARGLELKPLELAKAPPLPKQSLAALKRATGYSTRDLKGSAVFVGTVNQDGVEQETRLASVPFELDGQPHHALFALNGDGVFLRAAVVNDAGQPLDEWRHTLKNFAFYELPRLDGAQPRSELGDARRQWSRRGKDPEAQLGLALLDVLKHMNDQASVFNLPPEGRALGPAESSEMASQSFTQLADLAEPLAPLLGQAADEFVRLATESSTAAANMAAAARAEDWDAMGAAQRSMMGNCRSCHDLNLPELEGLVKGTFAAARESLGIGDGFYQVGHDLRITHHDRERMQIMADAMRCAALLADGN